MKFYSFILIAVSLLMTGCGGGGGDGGGTTSAPTVPLLTLSGFVADGAVANALVFADFDQDGVQDAGEVVQSSSTGYYQFQRSAFPSSLNVLAYGGVDQVTAQAFSGQYSASVDTATFAGGNGTQMLTPLTTLSARGVSTANLGRFFPGLTGNVNTSDPFTGNGFRYGSLMQSLVSLVAAGMQTRTTATLAQMFTNAANFINSNSAVTVANLNAAQFVGAVATQALTAGAITAITTRLELARTAYLAIDPNSATHVALIETAQRTAQITYVAQVISETGSTPAAVPTVLPFCTYVVNTQNPTYPSLTSQATWSCDTLRRLSGNGIPNHATGTFPNSNNPHSISAQSVSATFPLTPVTQTTASNVMVTGYALNGVKFDPNTAGTCTGSASCSLAGNGGEWRIEALGQSAFNFGDDMNHAHVQPGGAYHYHGVPVNLVTSLQSGNTQTMVLVGWAMDGFPVYARLGYTSALDATSGLSNMTPSWRVKATADSGRPSTALYPMGTFSQDYEYVAGLGNLDACNGRVGVTPEYPQGTYHYFVTDQYPFIGRCLQGQRL